MPSSRRTVGKLAAVSRSFSSSSSQLQERWARRCRLLDVSRGNIDNGVESDNAGVFSSSKKRPLPTFPLEARHFGGYGKLDYSNGSLPPNTPKEFHQRLCKMIRNAKERVRIASLYVGPATSNQENCEEAEMLEALSELVDRNTQNIHGSEKVSVKIILDENRALRPVPTTPLSSTQTKADSTDENPKVTTSSAEAVARAIGRGSPDDGDSSSSLHLFRVLPPTTIGGKNWLPNPLDEIAGVFHIKIYIVDDQLLLSGANLSREYFKDRMDRYLHLVEGANGLVDFYAELVEILCRHSNEYDLEVIPKCELDVDENPKRQVRQQGMQREEFLREITKHFQDQNYENSSIPSAQDLLSKGEFGNVSDSGENQIVAVGVPTFQAPAGYFQHMPISNASPSSLSVAGDVVTAISTFWSLFWINLQQPDKVDFVTDVEATVNLLQEAGKSKDSDYMAQLSSAYLNPTGSLLSVLRNEFQRVELLTAGKISHGFKPKKKEGSHGKDWTIPSVFDKLVDECMSYLRSSKDMDARLFYWERPDWTFHAKGIWLKEETDLSKENKLEINDETDNSEVAAVVVGSSNFGYRSFYRDMESNLLLVFPPGATNALSNDTKKIDIASSFGEEWKNLIASSKREVLEKDPSEAERTPQKGGAEKAPPLPWPIIKSIPYIKTFF